MQKTIRFVAQSMDSNGNLIEELILKEEVVEKAPTLKELGYLHTEQIDFLQKIQDFKIKQQIILNQSMICPKCGDKTAKHGVYKSEFHAVLTDHEVSIQLRQCKCGWQSPASISGVYGSAMHPDLLKKQALQGCETSYAKASALLNAESAKERPINGHSQIHRTVKLAGEILEAINLADQAVKEDAEQTLELTVNIDGGHIKSKGEARSFEAMVVTVYQPQNLKPVNENRNEISSKTIVASAKNDEQATIKQLFKNAAISQGLGMNTVVTCLADGADNCKSIAHSITQYCKEIIYILDWFHIAKKFKNIAIPDGYEESYEKIKWHLWNGNVSDALLKLREFIQCKDIMQNNALVSKLEQLYTYISNNSSGIVNYQQRQHSGLVFTSNLAESNVNTIINERQKGKQKMSWGRDGAHNILQIRANVRSSTWKDAWNALENRVYKLAA